MDMTPLQIIAALRAKGLTQKEIGDSTGLSQSMVSKVERGDIKDVVSRHYRALVVLYAQKCPTPTATAEA